MEKVVKRFPLYQIGFVAIIIICLFAILFFTIIFLLGSMIVEKALKNSIYTYYEQLLNL